MLAGGWATLGPRGRASAGCHVQTLQERIVCVNGAIDDHMSNLVVAQLLYLESESPEKPVRSRRGTAEIRTCERPH